MKRTIIFPLAVLLGTIIFTQCQQQTKGVAPTAIQENENQFGGYASKEELGEHLVGVAGCHDCHTPKKMGPMGPELDQDRALSGHPSDEPIPELNRKELESKGVAATQGLTSWIGPWGVSFTANITSDPTGIGNWTLEQFSRALREGKSKGLATNRDLLPPMPLMKELTDQEIEAIFAYLQSTQPIDNVVPQALPPLSALPN
ncbi:MAG: cytochrome c [Cyclobacteriaceae bacterium]|mgnify:CR=1 FL=1|nr:cytochrome c [Cyclobacteriaceae bacterium]MDX5465355.1 cytochrome c [Cyclobacteriaceae bacterium]